MRVRRSRLFLPEHDLLDPGRAGHPAVEEIAGRRVQQAAEERLLKLEPVFAREQEMGIIVRLGLRGAEALPGAPGFARLEDAERGSVPARCIGLARQGLIAFSYDMVGYNDTAQLGPHRKVFAEPRHLLWGLSLMGLQTWNSIRALDFLESLQDVDRSRLGCTGASGGGTQTFILGAIDDRLAAQAPHVMVSHSMQGGCQCENAPGLRIDYSNMEIAAVPAPRPQILVAATGDWTKMTMTESTFLSWRTAPILLRVSAWRGLSCRAF